jgi:hypothetical protein
VSTLYHNRHLVFNFAHLLKDTHFSDLDAKAVYRKMVGGLVVTELPFAARTLALEELEAAVEDITTNHYMQQTLQHAQHLASAVSRHDLARIEELHTAPPSLMGNRTTYDAVEMGRTIFEAVAAGKTLALKPQSDVLKPLDLVLAPNTILGIGAHSGVGKSALAEQILLDITSQGGMALDVSLELDATTKGQRYLQHFAGADLSPKAFQEGRVKPAVMLPVLDRFMWLERPSGTSPGVPRRLRIEDSAVNLPQVVAIINAFVEDHDRYRQQRADAGEPDPGPPVVLVDFLQQIEVPGSQDEIYKKTSRVAERLYTLAKQRHIAMIWISQLRKSDRYAQSRASTLEEELPGLNEYEGGGRIGNLVHTALFLHEPKETFRRNGYTKVYAHMPKQRSGAIGTYEGLRHGTYMNFDFEPSSIRTKI